MVRLTRFILRHRRLVVLGWLALALAGGASASYTTSRLGKTFTLPGAASYRADVRVVRDFGVLGDPVIAVLHAPTGERVTAARARSTLLGAEWAASLGGRYRVVGYGTSPDPRLVTAGDRSTFLLVFTPPQGFGSPNPAPGIDRALRRALPKTWHEQLTGTGPLQVGPTTGKGPGLFAETLIGGVGALFILSVVFASALAIVPLLMAAIAIPTTFLLLLGLTALTSVNFVVQFLIGLVGLGVAIDYSLLVVTRWREEAAEHTAEEAVVIAMDTAGRAVVFSGCTVAIGLMGLVVLPVPFLHSMGFGGVLIPLVSVAVALTLLPIFLARFGPVLDRHRLRRADSASPPWFAWARFVDRHRVAAAIVGLVIAGVVVSPVARLSVGQPVSASLSSSGPAHAALVGLERGGVPSGVLNSLQVVVEGPASGVQGTRRLAEALRSVPGVYDALPPATGRDRTLSSSVITVLPRPESGAPGGAAVTAALRGFAAAHPSIVAVSGTGPDTVDFDHAIYGRFPLLLALVSLFTFLVLVRAFRSLLLAAKAVVLNLVSLGAAYGVLVFVWQEGHGSRLLFGLGPTGSLTNWVPVVVFAFLFGLAIDYEVFILVRMREAYDEQPDTSRSVIEGLGRTGRLVTSAAAILTFAFVSMATAPLAFLKVLATGLAAGIVFDAFVVRSLIVPALVSWFGRANWYLPRWADERFGQSRRQEGTRAGLAPDAKAP